MEFEKYQHLERLGTQAVEGILDGIVYAFYKIDGTNGSIWWNRDRLCFGSRNRELSTGNDNAGFMNALKDNEKYISLLEEYPIRLYGEWLVPHSLKTYREDAWRRFYVFDVQDTRTGQLLPYEDYKWILDKYEIDYIPPVAILKKPTMEDCYKLLDKSGQFLVEDGKGMGEGLVFKNYGYSNKYGNQIWAKLISNEFKEVHHKEMGAPVINGSYLVEERIVDKYVTEHFILKEKAKIENEVGEWTNQCIPRLLGTVFYELVQEEMWNIMKEFNRPTISFQLLNKLTLDKTKKVIGL